MFPLQQGNELCFKISSGSCEEDTIPQQDLIQLGLGREMGKSRQGDRNHRSNPNNHENDDSTSKKKMHREIERERRQEMAARCASLRSLLPLEYIKGKRSISDHMYEAVNYIKHLQKNISVLSSQRDELKKVSNLRGHDDEDPSSGSCSACHVMVYPLADGLLQILFSIGLERLREHDFPLSRALEILLAEGLVIVSCSSTKVNKRLFHTIQAEVGESCTDPLRLQEKLTEAVVQSSNMINMR